MFRSINLLRSLNAVLMQTSVKFHGTVHLSTILRHRFGRPATGAKRMTSSPIRVNLLRHSCSLLWLLSLFSTFWSLLWTGFSLWLHSTKKGMQSQCRLEWYFLAARKQITSSQSTNKQDDLLFRSFAITCLLFWFWTVRGLFWQDATWRAFVT